MGGAGRHYPGVYDVDFAAHPGVACAWALMDDSEYRCLFLAVKSTVGASRVRMSHAEGLSRVGI